MKKALLLALAAAPLAVSAAGTCDIAAEDPVGSGKAGKAVCVNVGDERSCKAMAEAFASPAWLKAHPPRYGAEKKCANPTDPFTKPAANPDGGVPGPKQK